MPDDLAPDLSAALANAGAAEMAASAGRGRGGVEAAAVVDHAEAEVRLRGGERTSASA